MEIYPKGASIIRGFMQVLGSLFFHLFCASITAERHTK